MRFAETTFRPVFGRVLAVAVAVIVVLGIAGFIVIGDGLSVLRYAWGPLLVAFAAFAAFWFPSISVAEHEVTVRNVFSTTHVPWPAIQRVDTKYALTLYLPGGRKVAAWASPAPNRYAAQVGITKETRLAAREQGGAIRPGDLLDTPSGAVAYVIRRHWEELRDDGKLDQGAEPDSVRREWHWPVILVLGALLIATLLGALL